MTQFMGEIRRRSPRGRRRWWFPFAATSLSFFATFGALELAVRVFCEVPPAFYDYDPRVGYFHRPGATGTWRRPEFTIPVRISSQGLRDRDFAIQKPPGVRRIAVLGDSQVEGLQVPMVATFAKRLEARLNESGTSGTRWEVMNFGVAGFGTTLEYLAIEHRVAAFHPDMIVLAVFCWNDITDNSAEFRRNSNYLYLDRNSGGWRVVRGGYALTAWLRRRVANQSALYRLVQERMILAEAGRRVDRRPRQEVDPYHLYDTNPPPIWKRAWTLTELSLRLISRHCRDHGIELLVVTLGDPPQIYDDEAASARAVRWADHPGRIDLGAADEQIRRICRLEGVVMVGLAEGLREAHLRTRRTLHYPIDRHLNVEGHEEVSHRLFEIISRASPRKVSGATLTPSGS